VIAESKTTNFMFSQKIINQTHDKLAHCHFSQIWKTPSAKTEIQIAEALWECRL